MMVRVPVAAGVGRALLAAVLVIMVLYAGITLFPPGGAGEYDEDGFIDEVLAESAYPGGDSAWRAYLQRSIVYPAEAVAKNIEGTVAVRRQPVVFRLVD